jgi:hypothetical protein
MFAFIGGNDPPPYAPGLVYGFAGRALAWRIAFFVIDRTRLAIAR